ncbi:MAG: hypothetical protein ACK5WR_08960, partial [Planctomycetaceae bacterium]
FQPALVKKTEQIGQLPDRQQGNRRETGSPGKLPPQGEQPPRQVEVQSRVADQRILPPQFLQPVVSPRTPAVMEALFPEFTQTQPVVIPNN